MRIAAYIREFENEVPGKAQSFECQESKIRTWAAAYGHEVVSVHRDNTDSDDDADRPGFQEIKKLLRRGAVGGIIVTKIDRLSSSPGCMARVVDLYFGFGRQYQLICTDEIIDTKSAAGNFGINMAMGYMQYERATHFGQ